MVFIAIDTLINKVTTNFAGLRIQKTSKPTEKVTNFGRKLVTFIYPQQISKYDSYTKKKYSNQVFNQYCLFNIPTSPI